jgi:hypothetical protein
MLETTKTIKQDLKNSGIELKDIQVEAKYSKLNGYSWNIVIYNPEKYLKFRIIRKILRLGYGVGVSRKYQNLSIFTDYSLRKYINLDLL